MIRKLLIVISMLFATPIHAACIDDLLSIGRPYGYEIDGGRLYFTILIANSGDHPLGGLYLSGPATIDGRPSPIGDAVVDQRRISGALLPRENMTVTGHIVLDARAEKMVRALDRIELQMQISLEVLNVADEELNPYLDRPFIGGWTSAYAPDALKADYSSCHRG